MGPGARGALAGSLHLDPELLFPLADAGSVRCDRRFIQENYPNASFPDGTPVRFPEPRPQTRRYDLDAAHPGLVSSMTALIGALEMARYQPSLWLDPPDPEAAEGQLGGLLQSQLLKRFESCWAACLATVRRMLAAHDAFLAAWDGGGGIVPSKDVLREAARIEGGEAGIAAWLEDAVEEDAEARPAGEFQAGYGDAVSRDRDRLEAMAQILSAVLHEDDPKPSTRRQNRQARPVLAAHGRPRRLRPA